MKNRLKKMISSLDNFLTPEEPYRVESYRVGGDGNRQEDEYAYSIMCDNCDKRSEFYIKKGYHVRDVNPICPNCGCRMRPGRK